MDEPVTHSRDASPWKFRVEVPDILRNPFCCLPNDFQASDKCPFCLFIIDKVSKRELARMLNQKCSFFEDVMSEFSDQAWHNELSEE